MNKKVYTSPKSELLGLNGQDDLLAGGSGMFKTSGMPEEYMAPARKKAAQLYI